MAHRLMVVATLALAGVTAVHAHAAEPVVSVWYRGSPAGVPKLDDLAAIRAIGFRAVTWPAAETSGVAELRRMADLVGLAVQLRSSAPATSADSATPATRLDVAVAGGLPNDLQARVWRAVAHGAREITFDPGQKEGTGLLADNGQARPWVAPAVAITRQLSINAELVERLRPGPPVILLEPADAPALEVVLLDADQSWVIVATNLARERTKAVARLPVGVPYALWVSWIDGNTIGMLSQPTGPRWTFEIDGGTALVYIIGKKQR